MVGRKRLLISFWKCMCFILITAVGHPALKWAHGEPKTHFPQAPSAKQVGKRHIRGCLRGGLAVARLGPLLFMPGWSGGLLRRRIQGYLGPGSLALREGVASCRAWAPSITPTLRSLGLRGGWRWLSCLLSWRRPRATGSSRRAGAHREEVLHRLRLLLSLREAFRKALHSWSKQAAWRNRSVEEGNFVRLFHLRHREPEVAL